MDISILVAIFVIFIAALGGGYYVKDKRKK